MAFPFRRSLNRFSRWLPWQPSWISDRKDICYVWSTITLVLPSNFPVDWPFGSGKVQDNFLRLPPWRPFWSSNQKDLAIFDLRHPNISYELSSQEAIPFRRRLKSIFKMASVAAIFDFSSQRIKLIWMHKAPWYFLLSFELFGLSVQQKFKINFQDGCRDGYLRFQIKTNLVYFDLQVTLIFPIKFRVTWPFRSGIEVQNRFSRWPPGLRLNDGLFVKTLISWLDDMSLAWPAVVRLFVFIYSSIQQT